MTETLFEIDVNDSRSWFTMGYELYYELGKKQEALQCFEKSLELDPENLHTLSCMANCLSSLRKNQEALNIYDKILAKNPNEEEVWKSKGFHLALRMNNGEESISSFKKVVELKPKDPWSYYYLICVLSDCEKYDEALDFANICLDLSPTFSGALYCKLHILENLGRYQEVIDFCDAPLLEYNFGNMYTRANALANLKRFEEAVVWYDKAYEINSGNIWGIENKKRALEAIKTGKVSDIPFTYFPEKNFNFDLIDMEK